jgi:hypothetical protein
LPCLGVDCATFRDRTNARGLAFGRGHWTD